MSTPVAQVENENAIAIQEPVSLGLLSADGPRALMESAANLATELARLINERRLYVILRERPYVVCEGWTTLAAMLGVMPREVTTTENDGIFTATVELVRISDGMIIGRASAECGADDEKDRHGKPIWSNRPRYARRSMAQTRATAKACRLAFSWIMKLAGYEPTPAEEMNYQQEEVPAGTHQPQHQNQQAQRPAPPRPQGPPNLRPLPPITLGMKQGATEKKRLEAEITRNGLDRERVKAWVLRKWGFSSLNDLPVQYVPELMRRFPVWREQAKADRAHEVWTPPPNMVHRDAVTCSWEPPLPDITGLLVTARCECGAEIEGTFPRIHAAGWITEDNRFCMCKQCATSRDAAVPAGGIAPVDPAQLRARAASLRQSAQYADDRNARRREEDRASELEREAIKNEKYQQLVSAQAEARKNRRAA